jgi:hypothetical protein
MCSDGDGHRLTTVYVSEGTTEGVPQEEAVATIAFDVDLFRPMYMLGDLPGAGAALSRDLILNSVLFAPLLKLIVIHGSPLALASLKSAANLISSCLLPS